jgi:signal transduction histidine kinase
MERHPEGPPANGTDRNDHLMLAAMACLWVVAVWFAAPKAYQAGEYVRLAIFSASSVIFLLLTVGILRWNSKGRNLTSYFALQFVAVAVAAISMRNYGPVWLLVLPAASEAVMFLPLRGLVVMLAAHLVIVSSPLWNVRPADVPVGAINVLSSFLFTVGCSYAIRRERESRRELQDAHQKLQEYAEKIQGLAIAEERNRLAQEIHDGAAHHLTAANVLVEAGLAVLPADSPEEATTSLRKAQGQIRAALTELRAAVAERFQTEPALPLVARVQRLIDDGKFDADFTVAGGTPEPVLPLETERALYRVAQEALTNARKHAPGARITMKLDFTHTGRATFVAENEEPGATASGDGAVGLLSLRERIQRLGGEFHAGLDRSRGRFVVKAEVAR